MHRPFYLNLSEDDTNYFERFRVIVDQSAGAVEY